MPRTLRISSHLTAIRTRFDRNSDPCAAAVNHPPARRPYTCGMTQREWYSDGLRFECTMCGACCTGAPGYVLFTDEEARAIASRIGVTLDAFYKEYTQDTAAGRSLAERQTEHGLDCVFLDRASVPGKAVCGIHEHRPTQCRTFPFWPEHLKSPGAWRRAAKECEGIGRGAIVPIEQIRIQRDAHTDDAP